MTSRIVEKLKEPEYRKAFVASQINLGIPFQIRALMKARGWTQAQLAEKTQMLQPRISGLMTPGRTRPNIETLRRIAEAFDCGLVVRFAPFGELVRWSEAFDPESFQVPSFENDPAFNAEAKGPDEIAARLGGGTRQGTKAQVLANLVHPSGRQWTTSQESPSGDFPPWLNQRIPPMREIRVGVPAGVGEQGQITELTPDPKFKVENPSATGALPQLSCAQVIQINRRARELQPGPVATRRTARVRCRRERYVSGR